MSKDNIKGFLYYSWQDQAMKISEFSNPSQRDFLTHEATSVVKKVGRTNTSGIQTAPSSNGIWYYQIKDGTDALIQILLRRCWLQRKLPWRWSICSLARSIVCYKSAISQIWSLSTGSDTTLLTALSCLMLTTCPSCNSSTKMSKIWVGWWRTTWIGLWVIWEIWRSLRKNHRLCHNCQCRWKMTADYCKKRWKDGRDA